jgi:hypothetical protein
MKAALKHLAPGLALVSILSFALGACGTPATPTLFVPPTAGAAPVQPPPGSTPSEFQVTSEPTSAAVPTILLPSPTPTCTDGLTYVHDVTIPDGTNVTPGQPIDKQWLVKNSGSCNWDVRYRLKLVGGDAMGVAKLLALYPARAGTEANLDIVFIAPSQAGLYQSQWQAMNPDGQTFGDPFYVQVSVTP